MKGNDSFYDISFSNFKTNLNEDISNNFNFYPEFYNEFQSINENIGDILKNNVEEEFFILNGDNIINLQYNNDLVKHHKDKIIEAIENRIIKCIINNTNIIVLEQDLVKYIKYYNGSDPL